MWGRAFYLVVGAALAAWGFSHGKIAIGVLALVVSVGGTLLDEGVRRSDSDDALMRWVVFRPFFIAGFLLALVGIEISSHTTYDWVLIAPLAVLYLVMGVLFVVAYRRLRREERPEHAPPP